MKSKLKLSIISIFFLLISLALNTSSINYLVAQGSILEGASITLAEIVLTGLSKNGYNSSIQNQKRIKDSGIWTPTQYVKGEIISQKYSVKQGDTLWQISKGYYGDGSLWKKILQNNSSKISFLTNNQQAKIYPGQILNIP